MILNYGAHDDTLRCLRSLEDSVDLDLDVLVVDNGPEGESHRALGEAVAGRAEVMATGDNLGYAAGNNLGLAWAIERRCDLIWILNPDTLVLPATLPALRAHLDEVRDCGVVGPRLVLPGSPSRIWFDGGVVDETTADTGHLSLGTLESKAPAPVALDVGYVTGASMLVRRSMVEQIGPIPEEYFLYYEETDWCRRAQAAGWRTMVNQRARMVHLKRSSGAFPEPYYLYYMTRNRYHFAQDCLGVDGELAWKHLDAEFLAGWRTKVERNAPKWLATFDEIVTAAKDDARAGLYGRSDRVAQFRSAREDAREPSHA